MACPLARTMVPNSALAAAARNATTAQNLRMSRPRIRSALRIGFSVVFMLCDREDSRSGNADRLHHRAPVNTRSAGAPDSDHQHVERVVGELEPSEASCRDPWAGALPVHRTGPPVSDRWITR